jgi:F-type H+-transporting ATPase subunit delta
VSAGKIATRYAISLLALTKADAALQDQIDQNLFEISTLYDNKALKKVLASPVVNASLFKEVFDNATTQLKSPVLLKEFLRAVIGANRISIIPEISEAFHSLLLKERGIVEATVVTAVPLDESEFKDIQAKVESLLHKKVTLNAQIDKSILGGFVIRIDNSLLDMSLKTKLDNMTKFAVS